MDTPKFTPRQQQILDIIHNAITSTGAPPTRAEIARTLGFKSVNAAEEHLRALARKGVFYALLAAIKRIAMCRLSASFLSKPIS